MFKTKEELIKEIKQKNLSTKEGVSIVFKSFAERVEFYKKWAKFGAEPWRIRNEDEELYDKWKAYDHKNNWTTGSNGEYDVHYYHQWLFDYCFGDIE